MKSYFSRFVSVFLALVLLNCSVDTPEASRSGAEDLRLNKQESLIELVLEKGMGYENAIPECEDHDQEPAPSKKFSVDCFVLPSAVAYIERDETHRVRKVVYQLPDTPDPSRLTFSPPPETGC